MVLLLAACGATRDDPTTPGSAAPVALSLASAGDSLVVAQHGVALDAPPTLRLRDAKGGTAARAGVTVRVSIVTPLGAPSTRIRLASDSVARSDASGIVRFDGLALEGVSGTARLAFTSSALPPITIPLRLEAGPLAPALAALQVAPDTVPVGGSAQLTLLLVDGAGNKRVSPHRIEVALANGASGGTITPIAFTPADSLWRGSVVGTQAGSTSQVRVVVDGATIPLTRSFTVTTSPSTPVATSLRLDDAPADTTQGFAIASGSLLPTLHVSLRDVAGASVRRAGVRITPTLVDQDGAPIPGSTLSGSAPVSTDSEGRASFVALAPSARTGRARIVFREDGLAPASFPIRLGAGSVSGSTSTLTLDAGEVAIGGRVVATVTPRDAAGNALGPGHTVQVGHAGGTSAGTWSAPTYDATDSAYRATFAASTAGTSIVVGALVNGVALATSRPLIVRSSSSDATIMTVNAAATFPISRYIYGANFVDDVAVYGNATLPPQITLNRLGGNRLSAYNWENNYSNAGADYEFQNDRFLHPLSTVPGEAVKARAGLSFARGQAFLATIPMLGYVAADACGCNVGISDAGRAARLATHFKVSRAFKGSALSASPNTADAFVAQDEFVHWFESTFPGRSTHPTAPVFFSLDNEPDIWHSTHTEIQSYLNDNAATPRFQTYDGLIDTSIAYARAVKSVLPNALVFGPAVATYAGITTGGRYPLPDPVHGTRNFFDVYLSRMRAAEATHGRRLLDVLDLHWYPAAYTSGGEITNDFATQDSLTIETRMQAPRSLWDPSYDEGSWVSGVTGGPIRLIPRLREQIAANYPGTKLAITEYYYGRAGDISGGIAQADLLGIFGREGVFAAALWPQANVFAPPFGGDGARAWAYAFAAFRMFLDYDGAGARFGDLGLDARTNDVPGSSVYASRDATGRVVLVVINKGRVPRAAEITVTGATGLARAQVYTLTSAAARPVRQGDLLVTGGTRVSYTMPALSVSTLVLMP